MQRQCACHDTLRWLISFSLDDMPVANKKRLCLIIAAAGMVNLMVFFVVALLIGGDAVNGHQTDGHYFLANHGRYTEVSRPVFLYSRAHVYTIFCTWPFVMISLFLYNRYKKQEASAQNEAKVI
jgi:hypothetical protein